MEIKQTQTTKLNTLSKVFLVSSILTVLLPLITSPHNLYLLFIPYFLFAAYKTINYYLEYKNYSYDVFFELESDKLWFFCFMTIGLIFIPQILVILVFVVVFAEIKNRVNV